MARDSSGALRAENAHSMQSIAVRAFTATSSITGRYALRADRLTDALNRDDSVTLTDATVTDLGTLAERLIPVLVLARSDLLIVRVDGQRGNPSRWLKTWPHAVTAVIAPFRVEATIHSVPGAHPTSGIFHRKPMVPLTDATISYEVMGRPIVEQIDTIAINRDALNSIVMTENSMAHAPRVPSPGARTADGVPSADPGPALAAVAAEAAPPVGGASHQSVLSLPRSPVTAAGPSSATPIPHPVLPVLEPSRRAAIVLSDPQPMTPTYLPRPQRH